MGVVTRKQEQRYVTSDPARMLNMFLTKDLKRSWVEQFIDEGTGELVDVKRYELVCERGTLIDQDVISSISFYIQSGDITEVEVSDQRRMAVEQYKYNQVLFKAKVQFGSKKSTFLLNAHSVENVTEILRDYIELNYTRGFRIVGISEIDSCHVLVDNLKTRKQVNAELDKAFLKDEIDFEQYVRASDKESEENQTAEDTNVCKFYQIEARIISKDSDGDENEFSRPFIVYAHNATKASVLIEKFLNDEQDEIARRYAEEGSEYEKREVFSHIEECRIINISAYIPLEFSKAYSYAEED